LDVIPLAYCCLCCLSRVVHACNPSCWDRRITVQCQLSKSTRPYLKKPTKETKGLGAWLRCEALSANPSTVRKQSKTNHGTSIKLER
jgi:hypothetical protein